MLKNQHKGTRYMAKNSIPKMLTSLIFTANTADGLETVYTKLKTFEKFGVTIDC